MTLGLDTFSRVLRLFVRSAVDELWNGVEEGLHVPFRVEIHVIRDQTREDLNPSELEIALFFPLHWVVQLVFVKIEYLFLIVYSFHHLACLLQFRME